ncbi:MAG TPA: hypothetical protein PL033_01510 [Candidatus Brocadiia bacterium]|nr:hypothetical protein [Candidatus Brocadiia bacterium]
MRLGIAASLACFLIHPVVSGAEQKTYSLKVSPPEHKRMKDPITGAELLFIATHPAKDVNFYFHERSWMADSSVVFFNSSRPEGGLMGYIFATGELMHVTTPSGSVRCPTAARNKNAVYGVRGADVVEISIDVHESDDPAAKPSEVIARERVICTLPEQYRSCGLLNENCDGSLVSTYCGKAILLIDTASGAVRELWSGEHGGHVQFSRVTPHYLSFAGRENRLMMIDVRDGQPRTIHRQVPGEMVTHECWWVNDTMTYCGGYRDGEAAVRVIDVHSGQVHIAGAGAWVPWRYETTKVEPDPKDMLNRWNWWHAAGDENGRWIAADNWYGDIVLFDAKTTQMRRLTLAHRVYSRGEHPHVGWDRLSKRVIFASAMLGGEDVCVATIPEEWGPDPATEGLIMTSLGLIEGGK